MFKIAIDVNKAVPIVRTLPKLRLNNDKVGVLLLNPIQKKSQKKSNVFCFYPNTHFSFCSNHYLVVILFKVSSG